MAKIRDSCRDQVHGEDYSNGWHYSTLILA